jgi:hypothetical protein
LAYLASAIVSATALARLPSFIAGNTHVIDDQAERSAMDVSCDMRAASPMTGTPAA